VSMDIYRKRPQLLTQVHAPSGPFRGESSLHICAVNRRERTLVELVHLAVEMLSPEEAERLIRGQTEGGFFTDTPMVHYGSTILAYACCFEMKDAVIALLKTGFADLNRRDDGCRLTGLMPLHAVVANSLSGGFKAAASMYDFMIAELPRKWRADHEQISRMGKMALTHEMATLSPLQIAALLGDRLLVKHILQKQCKVNWVWGPVTEWWMDLKGIDSSGTGSGDIMELIVRIGARRRTCEMLLDNFMNGFIYKLYIEKWHRFGRKVHYARRALDLAIIIIITIETFAIKSDPRTMGGVHGYVYASLALMGLVVEEELRALYHFAQNNAALREANSSITLRQQFRRELRHGIDFIVQHNVHIQLLAYCFAVVGAFIILTSDLESQYTNQSRGSRDWFPLHSNTSPGVLEHVTDMYLRWPIADEGNWALLWLVQAMALLLLVIHLAMTCFQPFESFSILLNTIKQMVRNDVSVYMTVFLWLWGGFWLALYILYPRSGENSLPHAPAFNTVHNSALELISLSLLAQEVELHLLPEAFDAMSPAQIACMALWMLLYAIWLILSVILMTNLLIAMLTNTFDDVFEEATLMSRLSFAIGIMKLEVMAQSFGANTEVGEPRNGARVYVFRTFKGGGGGEDGDQAVSDESAVHGDPFAPPRSSETSELQSFVKARLASLEERIERALPLTKLDPPTPAPAVVVSSASSDALVPPDSMVLPASTTNDVPAPP